MPREWFRIDNKADDNAEITIYGEIGKSWWNDDAVSAADFNTALKAVKGNKITLNINSPGGDVFDGLAIYNQLKRHSAQVHVNVDGLAASIASVIAMAGDSIHIPANALMMIHNPSSFAVGDMRDMRKTAETLDKAKESLVGIYAARTHLDETQLAQMMDDETWFNGEDAVGFGFADEATAEVKMAARFDLSRFRHPPMLNVMTDKEGRMPGNTQQDAAAENMDIQALLDSQNRLAESVIAMMEKLETLQASHIAVIEQLANRFEEFKLQTEQSASAEQKRRSDLLNLFEMFNTEADKVYDAHYQRLKADCLADSSCDLATAQSKIIAMRQQFSANPPADSLSGNVAVVEEETPPGEAFDNAVDAYMASHSCSKGAAIKAIASAQPELHKAWLKAQQGGAA